MLGIRPREARARVAHLVFVAAGVLPNGSSMIETHIPAVMRPLLRGLAAAGDGSIQYPAAFEWARWMGDLPPARAAEYAARLGVEPVDLDCAHGPMLSMVDPLVRILESV